MIEDEVLSPQTIPAVDSSSPIAPPPPPKKKSYAKLLALLFVPALVLMVLFALTISSKPKNPQPNSSSSQALSPTPLPTLPPAIDLKYPFSTNSALLDIEASVSGTIDPNINQLLYLLQLPDINHPIEQ